ncbi:hypothetical protein [Streptomyces hokutonensis]
MDRSKRATPRCDVRSRGATESGPERWLEHHTMRDWIWEAIEQLSPTT